MDSDTIVALATAPDARAGTTTSLAEKVFSADTILELRTSFNKPVPKKWLARKDHSYPSGYIDRATRLAKLRKVLQGLADDGGDGAVEDVDVAIGILLVRVTTHRRFVHGEFFATCGDQGFQLGRHQGE